MSASNYCLVFEGKISPDQDPAEVKKRLQKLFNKDAQTIEKLFSGKKVKIKQGLKEEQAVQYKAKMQAIGAVCEIESPATKSSQPTAAQTTDQHASTAAPASFAARAVSNISDHSAATDLMGSPTVANVPQSPPVSGKGLKLSDIDKAFTGAIQRVELPATYKIGVVAMGITMVLLPLLYLGLIALLGYGVINHAVAHTSWMHSLGAKFGFIAYVTPIIAVITVILFMAKPLFASSVVKSQKITLDAIQEPLLFHFVNKIALAVGAPRPKQIDVDCEVNASASFRKGLFSFMGDDLVLTIGMPLLAGISMKQLAGVLAHELGHFSQGVGMRFHYLTYKINSWFFYAVYARDNWDEKLDRLAKETDNWLSFVLNAARGGVWLTRKLLYVFMMAGHAVSSYMLRQMEFDADRYEAQIAGSQQFKDTTLQLQRLGVAYQVSHDYLSQAWEDKKLVNDFPALVAHNALQLPAELNQTLLNKMREAKTHLYDSHPGDMERITNAMKQQANGIFVMDGLGRDLFKRFDSMSKQVSKIYYGHELGLDFDPSKLVDINQVVKIAQDNEKQQEAYHTYFKDMAPVFDLPLSVNIFDTSRTDWDDLLAQYKDIENKLANQIADRRMLMKKADECYVKYQQFTAIYDLEQAGYILFPEWFALSPEVFDAYKKQLAMYTQAWEQSVEQLKPMFEINDNRLSIALTLLNHPKILEINPEHAQHLKSRNRFSLLINNVKRNAEYIVEFRHKLTRLSAFLACSPLIGQKPADFAAVCDQLLEDLKQSNQQLASALNRLDYPYVAEGEHQTVADYLETFMPRGNEYSSEAEFYIASGNVILEKLDAVYGRIISGLANVALTVDRLIPVIEGRAPMPEHTDEQVEQVAEQVAEHMAEQVDALEAEVARAVGAEDYKGNQSASFTEKSAAPTSEQPNAEKAEAIASVASKPDRQATIVKNAGVPPSSFSTDMVAAGPQKTEKANANHQVVEKAVEEPAKILPADKFAGTKSSFAVDVVVPEVAETKVRIVEEKRAEPKTVELSPVESLVETPAKAKTEDRFAGTKSRFAVDVGAPDAVESRLVVDPKTVETAPAEPFVEVPAEVPVKVKLADRFAGTKSSFAIDESIPEETKPATVVATSSGLVEEKSLDLPGHNREIKTANLVANVPEKKSVNVQPEAMPSATEKPVPVKSSNPFLSRSAFAQKLEEDTSSATVSKSIKDGPVVAQPSITKEPNPFLVNISSYQEKLAKENSAQQASISMNGLNAGSMPDTMASSKVDKPAGEQSVAAKQDKLSTFSTGGLSLAPMTGENAKSESNVDAKGKSGDPPSPVAQRDAMAIPTDNRQNAQPEAEEGVQNFFESPGLPNNSDSSKQDTGRSLGSDKPFEANAFTSRDSPTVAAINTDEADAATQTGIQPEEQASSADRPANS